MKVQERVTKALESLVLAMFLVWTVGIMAALISPAPAHDRQGVVEIYALTPVAVANPGV